MNINQQVNHNFIMSDVRGWTGKLIQGAIDCGASDAYIAGGFPRDLICNRTVKDVDIFYVGELDIEKYKEKVLCNKKAQPSLFKSMVQSLAELGLPDGYGDSGFNVTAKCLFDDDENYPLYDWPIQLIKLEDPLNNPRETLTQTVLDFPCNLSRVYIYLNGNPKTEQKFINISGCDTFITGVAEERIEFSPDCEAEYKQRLLYKYQDWYMQAKITRYLNRSIEEHASTNI